MKNIKQIILSIIAIISFDAISQECEIPIAVKQINNNQISQTVNEHLSNKLITSACIDGVAASSNGNQQFFIAGKIIPGETNILPGPPMLFSTVSYLTLYMGDNKNEQIYSTTTFEIRGVGKSEELAYINAIKSLNNKNASFTQMIATGKDKILDYYNDNYKNILQEANIAMKQKRYEEALYIASTIPTCCTGYDEASQVMLKIYQYYIDNQGATLLNKARATWAASPNSQGASEAFQYISQIDPASTSFEASKDFVEEMRKSVKSDFDFEIKEKYQDEVKIEKLRIEAAREVGVAYGKNQQPQDIICNWLK